MNDYLSKPFKEEELFHKIANLLSEKRLAGLTEDTSTGDFDALASSASVGTLKPLVVCNLAYLEEMGDGDKEFIFSMINTFLKQAPVEISELKKVVKGKNSSEIKFVAHKLKSIVSMVGAADLRANLEQIEKLAALQDGIPEIRRLLRKVTEQGETAIEEMKSALPLL